MKQNKDIKKGDKIWLYSALIDKESFYTVVKVKKVKTLVEVVVLAKKWDGKEVEITMYGHCSSCILSGYDKRFKSTSSTYTSDYQLVQIETGVYKQNRKYIDAGKALLNIAQYLK